MRWNCTTQGCFNVKKRPKIERLADCLPGRNAFTDLDAITEINGNLLVLEWKDHRRLHTGQRILFERMTALCPATVLIVEGDAEAKEVVSNTPVWAGRIGLPEPGDFQSLRTMVSAWSRWALANPATGRAQRMVCN